MANERNVPPHKKQTPTNNPELIDVWKKKYSELAENYPKWVCLELIGDEFDVAKETVYYHLFPEYKEYQKNVPCKKWAYEKADPEIHQKRVDYKRQYMYARYHIEEYIAQAYSCTSLTGSLSLDELSRSIELQTGIALAPDTILGLDGKYREKHGRNLVDRLPGDSPSRYRLVVDE